MRPAYKLLALVAALLPILAWLCFGRVSAEDKAQPIAAPSLVLLAAAPGWVDVEGGTRHLAARADGIVTEVLADTGSALAVGTVLLRLEDQHLQLEAEQAELAVKQHQQQLRALKTQQQRAAEEITRLQPLVQMQAESADVLRQANATADALAAEKQAAQLALAMSQLQHKKLKAAQQQLSVKAPSAGRVLRLDVHPGEAVKQGESVVWFAPDAPLIVRAELDERLFNTVRVGMVAEVEAEAGDGHIYPATLTHIARVVGPVRALPEVRAHAKDDRVVECILALGTADLLIGQRVIVRIRGAP